MYKSKIIFILSLAGVAFSGYLSGIKFFTKNCAFNESCPYFLGYPACYFGFGMFILLLIFSWTVVYRSNIGDKFIRGIQLLSVLGILFAGYFTLKEIPVLVDEGLTAYVLGLPTCALGLLFYIVIFCISLRLGKK